MEQINHKEHPLISVIMPAYNVEKFIGRAIESVLEQTYANLELVIGNDASTDGTCDVVSGYSDQRIVLCHEKINTGSAYLPRELAFENSKGEIVVALDADDFLEKHYIEKMYNRMNECNADVCCSKMVFVNEQGDVLGNGQTVPKTGFDYSVQISGKEAFFHTVPEWIIGMNGCMAKRGAWEYGFRRTSKSGKHGIHDDENVSRYLLLWAKKVVFAEADHYYTINSNSVTHVFNKRIFDWMRAEEDLLAMISEDYGKNSKEYKAIECNDYNSFLGAFNHLINSIDSIIDSELMGYLKEFKVWHDRLNWSEVKTYITGKNYLVNKNYYIEILLFMLHKGKTKTAIKIAGRGVKSIAVKGRNNKFYKWYIYRRQREALFRDSIYKKYENESQPESCYPKCVVNIIDGTVQSGGLADRLRGIISTYAICKRYGINYKLYFIYPFDLELYFVPAVYDWHIKKKDICRDIRDCDIVVLDATEDSSYQFRKQEEYLERQLKRIYRQTQVFTNAGFAYNLDYSQLFNELFKPSEKLQKAIDTQMKELGKNYISVSARFLDLLGDFNETFGYGKALKDDEAEKLLVSCVDQIQLLRDNYPDRKILVNSDSGRFLDAAGLLKYTYSIPGNITHIDNKQDDNNYERYEKTFLDFLMIANASEIFLLKGKGMHKSGYPYAASRIYNRAFHLIEF